MNSRPAVILLAGIGASVAIYVLAVGHAWSGMATMVPSFGASCALVFAHPESPFAKPLNVIGGHLVSSVVGLLILAVLGDGPVALAVGVGFAITGMMATRTMHPPAGGDPLIIIATGASASFIVTPILLGTIAIVAIGMVYRRSVDAALRRTTKEVRPLQ